MKSRKNKKTKNKKKTKNNIKQKGSAQVVGSLAIAFLIRHLRLVKNSNNIQNEEIHYNGEIMNYDLFIKTMLNLSYRDLQEACAMNKQSRVICNDELFWYTKITMDYGDVPQIPGKTWKEMYQLFIPIFKPSVLENFTIPRGIEVLFKSEDEDKLIWAKVLDIREFRTSAEYAVKTLGTNEIKYISTKDVLNFEPPCGVAKPKWFKEQASNAES